MANEWEDIDDGWEDLEDNSLDLPPIRQRDLNVSERSLRLTEEAAGERQDEVPVEITQTEKAFNDWLDSQPDPQALPDTSRQGMSEALDRILNIEKKDPNLFRQLFPTPKHVKDTIVALGAMAGGTAGVPLGPKGMVFGSALGAGGGEALWHGLEGTPIEKSVPAILNEMKTDAMFTMGGAAVAPAAQLVGKWVGKNVFGLSDSSIEMARNINEGAIERPAWQRMLGMGPKYGAGIYDVKDTNLVGGITQKFFGKVLGVFPFTTSSIRKKSIGMARHNIDNVNKYLDEVAPSMTLAQSGTNLEASARGMYKEFRQEAAARYKIFYNMSKEMGDPKIFKTSHIREAIESASTSIEGSTLKGPNSPFKPVLDKLNSYGDTISGRELRTLQVMLSRSARRPAVRRMGFHGKEANMIRAGLDAAFLQPEITEGVILSALQKRAGQAKVTASKVTVDDAKEAVNQMFNSLKSANKFFFEEMQKFESASAKKFMRVDRSMFKPTGLISSGTITSESLADALLTKQGRNLASIREVQAIAGHKATAKMTAKWLANKAQQFGSSGDLADRLAKKEIEFDWSGWTKSTGLDTEDGRRFISKALAGTGVTPDKLNKLVEIGKMYENNKLVDPSVFMARGAVFKGIRASTLLGMGAFSTTNPQIGIPMAAAILGTAKTSSAILSNRKLMDLFIKANDPLVKPGLRTLAYAQLLKNLEKEINKEEGDE
jgi:hypothetical protein